MIDVAPTSSDSQTYLSAGFWCFFLIMIEGMLLSWIAAITRLSCRLFSICSGVGSLDVGFTGSTLTFRLGGGGWLAGKLSSSFIYTSTDPKSQSNKSERLLGAMKLREVGSLEISQSNNLKQFVHLIWERIHWPSLLAFFSPLTLRFLVLTFLLCGPFARCWDSAWVRCSYDGYSYIWNPRILKLVIFVVSIVSRDRREYRYRIEKADTKAFGISISIDLGHIWVSVSISVSVEPLGQYFASYERIPY